MFIIEVKNGLICRVSVYVKLMPADDDGRKITYELSMFGNKINII